MSESTDKCAMFNHRLELDLFVRYVFKPLGDDDRLINQLFDFVFNLFIGLFES